MNILVINAGSSSIKYQLYNATTDTVLAGGNVEKISAADSRLICTTGGRKVTKNVSIPSHRKGLELIFETLVDKESGTIRDISEISAVGHRVLHSGFKYTQSILITNEALANFEENDDLAPLHNPYNTLGIREAMRLLPNVPHVAVFDSTFFQTLPTKATSYALPYEYFEKYKVSRNGIHGTSCRFVSREAAKFLQKPLEEMKMIICHLGSGSSLTAVKYGKSIDHSNGFTPLEGLMMGTRSGDIDGGLIFYLQRHFGMSVDQVEDLLNRKSGLLGVSGVSNDMRDVSEQAEKGNQRCQLAMEMYVYRAKKYLGAYAAAMGGVDVLVFTAGVGENSPKIRAMICEGMEFLGISLDKDKNERMDSMDRLINSINSETTVLVIPTNEERIIVEDTLKLIGYKVN